MNNQTANLYEIYNQRRQELLEIAQRQSDIIRAIKMDSIQSEGAKKGEAVAGLIERLESDKLRVLVVGRFSAGKSTFINALLGERLLPATPTPTTGVLCKIAYADENNKRVTLYPKKGAESGQDKPFDIDPSQLEDYIKIDHHVTEEEIEVTSKYRKMELFWPLELCANGVELIDSVGLDDPDSRDYITLDFVNSADAVLYVMSGVNANSRKDLETIESLRRVGHECLFFIITYYDQIKESAEMGELSQEEFKETVFKTLSSRTELGIDGIKFIDSRSALAGRIKRDLNKISESGIEDVEKSLESFLVDERGRAKLMTTLRALSSINKSAMKIIPARIDMLQTSVEELEKRYEESQAPLRLLETKQKLIISQVNSAITEVSEEAYKLASIYFNELPDKIPEWTDKYTIEAKIGFPPTSKRIEVLVKELLNYLKYKIEADISEWVSEHLTPMIESGVEKMQENLESDAYEFVNSASQIRVKISLGNHISDEELANEKGPSVWGRLLAGGYTLITGDFVTGGMGVVMGIQAMLRTISIQLVSGVLLVIFGLFNPVGILAALVGSILAGGFLNGLSLKKDLKKKVGRKMSDELRNRQGELSKSVKFKTKSRLDELKTTLDQGLSAEVSSIRDEVERVLQTRKKGQLDVKKEVKFLRGQEQQNLTIDGRLTELMLEAGLTVGN